MSRNDQEGLQHFCCLLRPSRRGNRDHLPKRGVVILWLHQSDRKIPQTGWQGLRCTKCAPADAGSTLWHVAIQAHSCRTKATSHFRGLRVLQGRSKKNCVTSAFMGTGARKDFFETHSGGKSCRIRNVSLSERWLLRHLRDQRGSIPRRNPFKPISP
jgi:hypothetical protein